MNLGNENHNAPDLFDAKPQPPLSLKVGTFACLVFLVVGLLVGGWIGSRLGPIRVVTHTVTVHDKAPKPKTIKVRDVPEACIQALDLIERVNKPIDEYTSATQRQIDLGHDAYTAAAQRDVKKINDVLDRQNKFNNNLSNARGEIYEKRELLDTAMKTCRTDLGR